MSEKMVTVCAECLRASCWLGTFMCEKSRNADTVEMAVSELLQLRREHPDWFAGNKDAHASGA